ncbi:hypothetical protein POTOM_022065 [Populus tomentosa]|uniref:ATP synthase subunit e, mitochondrial n=1 Tax=Populus tomentosa TaxID=118781 RepID=A0A8X8D1H3_POPTO|nr:hypothetical protein POTOM_022065 [Populus tomentosa]
MTPPPGPYSGASALALVARASAFSFGLVYGSVKLKILKKYTNTLALLLGEETESGCDVLDHGHGIIKFLYRGCVVDRDKPLGESIPSFDFHTWRAQITQWKRNLFTDQPPSFP